MSAEIIPKPGCSDPWELLRKTRIRASWMTGLYLFFAWLLMAIVISQNGRLDRSHRREVEYNKQIATLIAENRRLRGNCPTGPTPSGSLANR